MWRALLVVLLGVVTAAAQKPQVSRSELSAMEKSLDERIKRFNIDSPMEILGLTRGVYLEGYGAVFTAEVNLVQTPGLSPFRPAEFSKEEIARVRQAKLQRMPQVRQMLRDFLVASSQSLDRVPPQEQIAVALFLLSKPWEDKTGLPQQILMHARRQALLDVATNRADRSTLDTAIQERTF